MELLTLDFENVGPVLEIDGHVFHGLNSGGFGI